MHKTHPLGSTIHKTFLSLSVLITLFSHPEIATFKSDLLPFAFIKCNFIPHTFFTENTILLSLSNEELTFILVFYRLMSINTSENFFKKIAFLQRTSHDGIKHYALIVQNLQFLCNRKLVLSNECFRILLHLEISNLRRFIETQVY